MLPMQYIKWKSKMAAIQSFWVGSTLKLNTFSHSSSSQTYKVSQTLQKTFHIMLLSANWQRQNITSLVELVSHSVTKLISEGTQITLVTLCDSSHFYCLDANWKILLPFHLSTFSQTLVMLHLSLKKIHNWRNKSGLSFKTLCNTKTPTQHNHCS